MTSSDNAPTSANDQGVVVERLLDAPRELVWRTWTECEHFMRWYGPKNMSTHVCEIDFRVGGRHLYGMRSPDGWEYYTTGVYQEIVPIERFVTTDVLSDAEGNNVPPSHYGMPEDAPAETTVIVTLEEVDGGKTKLAVRQIGWTDEVHGPGRGWGLERSTRQAGGSTRGHQVRTSIQPISRAIQRLIDSHYAKSSKERPVKKFMFLHFGFENPTPEIMEAWGKWFESIADRQVSQEGFSGGREISKEGTRELPWDMDSITAFNIIEAESLDEAEEIAKSCPFIASIRVYELRSM